MTFAKRMKSAQTYRIVYGHSLLYNTLMRANLTFNPALVP